MKNRDPRRAVRRWWADAWLLLQLGLGDGVHGFTSGIPRVDLLQECCIVRLHVARAGLLGFVLQGTDGLLDAGLGRSTVHVGRRELRDARLAAVEHLLHAGPVVGLVLVESGFHGLGQDLRLHQQADVVGIQAGVLQGVGKVAGHLPLEGAPAALVQLAARDRQRVAACIEGHEHDRSAIDGPDQARGLRGQRLVVVGGGRADDAHASVVPGFSLDDHAVARGSGSLRIPQGFRGEVPAAAAVVGVPDAPRDRAVGRGVLVLPDECREQLDRSGLDRLLHPRGIAAVLPGEAGKRFLHALGLQLGEQQLVGRGRNDVHPGNRELLQGLRVPDPGNRRAVLREVPTGVQVELPRAGRVVGVPARFTPTALDQGQLHDVLLGGQLHARGAG